MGLCKRAKTLCYSGRLAPSPDAGSLPLLLMIMKLVCVMIVLELECLVSRQWQEQIRGFQPGQPGGCSWEKFIGSKYIQEYQVI